MSRVDKEDFKRLLNAEVPPLGKFLTKENLHYVRITSGLGEDPCIF